MRPFPLPRRTTILALTLALLTLGFAGWRAQTGRLLFGPGSARLQPSEAGLPAPEMLTDEAAQERIKNDPQYKSLQAAMQAAFYRVEKAAPGKQDAYYANNRAQAMRVSFAKGEAVLRVQRATPKDAPQGKQPASVRHLKLGGERRASARPPQPAAELKMRFLAAGYDHHWQTVAGESGMRSDQNRLTYQHHLQNEAAESSIEEWYVNKSTGIEHGFTLHEPLAGRAGKATEKVQLQMSLDTGGSFKVRVGGAEKGLILTDSKGREISYAGLQVFDSVGKELEARLSYRQGRVMIEFSDAGANYPVTIDPVWSQVQKLTASDAAADDRFGFSVAISGETAIVGANLDDGSAGGNQGSAYIFARNQGGADNWGEVKHLFASDAAAGDIFGFSVAISGETAIVGANLDDGSAGGNQGSAYIFARNQGGANNWGEVKHLFASDAAAGDLFGASVAISGETAIVGAGFDDGSAGAEQGSAYIYARNQGGADNWGEVKHLFASDAAAGDLFGASVAISGETAIVGAGFDDGSAGALQGSAYIYARNQGGANNWGEVKHLFASDAAAGDQFGVSVAISGETAIVGAYVDNGSAGAQQGSAYIYARNQGGANNWGEVKHLFASDAAAGDRFGYSVAISGETAIVGAFFDDGSAGAEQGSAYIYARNQGGADNWGEVKHLFASDAAADDQFGYSVAISGETAIVGAFFDDGSAGAEQGSAYIFSLLTPVVNPVSPAAICSGAMTNIALSGTTGASFSWTASLQSGMVSGFSNSSGGTIAQTLTGNGVVKYTVTATLDGCPSAPVDMLQTVNALAAVPTITPAPTEVCANSTSNQASGPAGASSYAWTIMNGTITSATNLQTISYTAGAAGNVTLNLTVTNASGCSASNSTPVTINQPPLVTTQPAAQIVGTGATVSFTAAASGAPAPTVQWQVNTGSGFNNLPLATNATLTLPNVTAAMNGYRYQAVFKNDCGTDTSQPALLTVNPFKVEVGDPLLCLNANGLVGVTATVTNNNAAAVTANFTATLPTTLNGLPGTGLASLNQAGLTVTAAAVTWSGTIPPNTTVIINYKAQIAAGTPLNMPICIDSDVTFNGGPKATVQECKTRGCPAGPVNVAVSDQKAGSLLVFPYYVSKAAEKKDTRLTISNIGEKAATVHLFFIDGTSCNQADQFLCLTPNASFSFKASEYDPDATGWLLAVAVDAQGRPVQYNGLIGNAFVNDGYYVDNYGAEAFWANSPLVATLNNDTATLFFDNQSYDAVPNQFAIELQSPVDAVGQRVVTVGLQGDLTTSKLTGAAQIGTGQVINGNEKPFGSFSAWLLGSCQANATILTTSPRVPNGMHVLIPSGQVGTMKLNIGAGVGLLLTPRTTAWKGIRTLHKMGLTTTTLTIPVVIPVC